MQSTGIAKPGSAGVRRSSAMPLLAPLRPTNSILPQKKRIPCPPRASAAPETSPQTEEEDLWQHPDRASWYLAKWAADDQPDWNPATFLRSTQIAPGVKEIVLDIEISRERVPIRNAYKHIGQRAAVRVNGGIEQVAQPSCPPFSIELLKKGLLRVRNDMTAGETKIASEEGSAKGELSLLVTESDSPELYKSTAADLFEIGPFVGSGMDLRGPVAALFLYPTIVMFCEGADGLAAARALVAATTDVGGLSFKMRGDVRMYYRAPNEASFCYRDELESWESLYGVKVITSTRDSFQDMFDDDQTLMYEPESTAALIFTGAEANEAEEAAADVCKEAEISVVVKQSAEQEPTKYLKNGNEYL